MAKRKKDEDPEKGGMSVAAAGRKGGQRTAERHGHEFYERIGKQGGQAVKKLIEAGQEAERAAEEEGDGG